MARSAQDFRALTHRTCRRTWEVRSLMTHAQPGLESRPNAQLRHHFQSARCPPRSICYARTKPRQSTVEQHAISICQDQLIFASQRPRHIFYQAEKSLSSRWNMGAMLVKQQIRQKNEPGG